MSSSETPGSSSAAGTQFLRRCRWPSTCRNGLGTSHGPHPPILVGSPISGLDYGSLSFTTCRFARPPVGADQVFTQPTGTFTSGLPTVWSPSPPPDITTAVTGQVPLAGLSPARTPTSIAAIPQADSWPGITSGDPVIQYQSPRSKIRVASYKRISRKIFIQRLVWMENRLALIECESKSFESHEMDHSGFLRR
jgi:hypothetical protein